MKKQEYDLKKQVKILAGAMMITGVFVWFFSGSEKGIIQDFILGIGIFWFITGMMVMFNVRK